MSNQIETVTQAPADVVRGLYDALIRGDVPGVLARLDPEVIVDEPNQLPYGGVHQGRETFVQSILGAMMGYAHVAITAAEIYEGPTDAVVGTLTAHTTGEEFPLTMVEIHQVEGGTVRKIDVYAKNPHELAAFYTRAEAGTR
ncbi:nuclear transport factor 2 family protein [Streptosporangium roseum]|uniref:nuclear transport factor 2 family protein n=1 Tax=Streptosporangium roseum TaxID=2001 RepID=UPI00331A2B78